MKPSRDPTPMAAFGERLRRLRREHKLTQQAVADYLQVHRTTYTKYEAGTVAPDYLGLIELADLFTVTVDCLLGRESSYVPPLLADEKGVPMMLTEQELELLCRYRRQDAIGRAKMRKLVDNAKK